MAKRMIPLLIFDYRVAVYRIFSFYENLIEFNNDKTTQNMWLKCAWAIFFNRGFTDAPLYDHHLVIVDDYAPYWRKAYLTIRGYPEYKGNRPEKPDQWFKVYQMGIDYLTQPKCPYSYLRFKSYEADDLAGGLVNLSHTVNRDIHLYTVDSDWQGLVTGELKQGCIHQLNKKAKKSKVYWLNMGQWTPRLRGVKEVKEHTMKRLRAEIDTASQLWDIKSIKGDRADNLIPGSPKEVIDLLNPPPEYNCLNNKEIKRKLIEVLNNPINTVNLNHLHKSLDWFTYNGFTPPMIDLKKYSLI